MIFSRPLKVCLELSQWLCLFLRYFYILRIFGITEFGVITSLDPVVSLHTSCIYIKQSQTSVSLYLTATVAQSVRALVSQAEGWVFEAQPRQT